MNYRIIGDSCTDLTNELKNDEHVILVPLSIEIDDCRIEDNETFDQADFLKRVAASPNCPKSSCPAPESYMDLFDFDGDIFVVTLSEQLSGSYNSAVLAKRLYLEDHPTKNIEIINSCSASVGQTLIVYKLKELIEAGNDFQTVVTLITKYRDELTTKFVLETLDTLRKNGRLNNMQAILASALNIKPVMGATPEGQIIKLDQARGVNRALKRMVDIMENDVFDAKNRIVGIAHCNNHERAMMVKEEILRRIPFKDTIVVDTAGISSLYACDGGIIVAY